MIIHSATVIVRDQAAAIRFYTEQLGWAVALDNQVSESMRFVTVVPPGGGSQLALGDPSWFAADRMPGGPTGISIATERLDEDVAALTARGVRFKGPIESVPWGRHTWFYDLDDNEFYLVGQ